MNTKNTLIYANNSDSITIKQDKRKSLYSIQLLTPNKAFIQSLLHTKILLGATVSDDYKTVQFKANKVTTLHLLNIDKQLGPLLSCLLVQLKYLLMKHSRTIVGYNPSNIIVINDNQYAFVDVDYITEINADETILMSYPFSHNDFYLSPELLKTREIPAYIHYKTTYFSFACLVISLLLSSDDFYTDYINTNNPKKIIEYLDGHPIQDSKLYWFLSRCLVEDPKARAILWI